MKSYGKLGGKIFLTENDKTNFEGEVNSRIFEDDPINFIKVLLHMLNSNQMIRTCIATS